MDLYGSQPDRRTPAFGVEGSGSVATMPARTGRSELHPVPVATGVPGTLELSEEFAWMGSGIRPNEQDAARAIEVISAVPLAAAVGWSVRGNQWSTHPRRLRTAVVSPSMTWDIEVMRGVREVDCLSGIILVRRRHLERLATEVLESLESPDQDGDETTRRSTKAMRDAGFRLLYLGDP